VTGFNLAELAKIIAARRGVDAAHSYTGSLIAQGQAHCARKLGEEAIEAVIAGVSGDARAIAAESADLLYHLLVLLEVSGVTLDEVMGELESRTRRSGHAEKAGRGHG
jgi:phosphoribosyl-ATP pyrophosphohydrolase